MLKEIRKAIEGCVDYVDSGISSMTQSTKSKREVMTNSIKTFVTPINDDAKDVDVSSSVILLYKLRSAGKNVTLKDDRVFIDLENGVKYSIGFVNHDHYKAIVEMSVGSETVQSHKCNCDLNQIIKVFVEELPMSKLNVVTDCGHDHTQAAANMSGTVKDTKVHVKPTTSSLFPDGSDVIPSDLMSDREFSFFPDGSDTIPSGMMEQPNVQPVYQDNIFINSAKPLYKNPTDAMDNVFVRAKAAQYTQAHDEANMPQYLSVEQMFQIQQQYMAEQMNQYIMSQPNLSFNSLFMTEEQTINAEIPDEQVAIINVMNDNSYQTAAQMQKVMIDNNKRDMKDDVYHRTMMGIAVGHED